MKTTYKDIADAIFTTAIKEKRDYRNIMREWIQMFERYKVKGWNRDKFLDEMIKTKEEIGDATD